MPAFEGEQVMMPDESWVPSAIRGRVGVVQGLALAQNYQPGNTDTNDQQLEDPDPDEPVYIVMFPELEMPYHIRESWLRPVQHEAPADVWARRR